MRFGFVKCAAMTPEIRVADCEFNAGNILSLMQEAAKEETELLVLPELCLTGATCGDLFFQQPLLSAAEKALADILEHTRTLDLVTVLGLPVKVKNRLYNCAAVLSKGEVLGIVPKSCIPTGLDSEEGRHFTPAPEGNSRISFLDQEVPFGKKLLFKCREEASFTFAVQVGLQKQINTPAAILANPAADPDLVGRAEQRRTLIKGQSLTSCAGIVFANAGRGESTTDLVFSGHDLIAAKGRTFAESKPYGSGRAYANIDTEAILYDRMRSCDFADEAEEYLTVPFSLKREEGRISVRRHPFLPEGDFAERAEEILAIQSAGLKKRLAHTHAASPVLGISGGLDSTLALLVTVRAMDELGLKRSDIVAVTMPCFGTTARTRGNAEKLCDALGVTLRTVDITAAVKQHFADLGHDENDHSVLFENAQARERTQVLMDAAHQHNGLVVGTGDLSELALGWATYNGDHMSAYGVNAAVPKTLMRHIVKYVADTCGEEELKAVLLDILATPISPELLPAKGGDIAQKTEELVGPYDLHDFFLYYVLRWGFAPEKILYLAQAAFGEEYSREVLLHWLKNFYRRFFTQQFKRSCLPDGPKVGSITLSPRGGWRMPSDAVSKLWLDAVEQL